MHLVWIMKCPWPVIDFKNNKLTNRKQKQLANVCFFLFLFFLKNNVSFERIFYDFHKFYLKHCDSALINQHLIVLLTNSKLHFRRMDVDLVGADAMWFDSLMAPIIIGLTLLNVVKLIHNETSIESDNIIRSFELLVIFIGCFIVIFIVSGIVILEAHVLGKFVSLDSRLSSYLELKYL